MRKFWFVISIGVVLLVGVFGWWQWGLMPVDITKTEKKTIVVPRGAGVTTVASKLRDEKLIRNRLHFHILTLVKGLSKKIQAGSYYLSPSMSADEILLALTKGRNDVLITIIEGLRYEQVGVFLQEKGFLIDLLAWREIIKRRNFEGKLFPDTYFFPLGASQEVILDIIFRNFEKKVIEGLKTRGSELESVLILASIVEREARGEEARKIVAGILKKRWQQGWPLQADATVQYAVGSEKSWWPKSLTKKDLEINSPYNTYRNLGLPPGPICSPSLESIKATVSPQNSLYWFYLSDMEGNMHYAQTANDHAKNIYKYLR